MTDLDICPECEGSGMVAAEEVDEVKLAEEQRQLEEVQEQVIRRANNELLSKIVRQLRERADALKTRSYMAGDTKVHVYATGEANGLREAAVIVQRFMESK